ncbi:MAG TPA: LysM domain-containing protein [Acidimicrobiales bacterium]|nr:LysM domain-containing protein [Acidimicrobiales bacterium]
MKRTWRRLWCAGAIVTTLAACGGGSSVADRNPGASGSDAPSTTSTLAPLFATTSTAPIIGPTPGPPASAIPPVTTEPPTTTTAPPTTTSAPTTTVAPTTTTASPSTTTTAPPPTTTAPPTTSTAPPPGPSPPAATPPAPPPASSTSWVVKPGDSFWSIAASVLQSRLGHAPSNAEIVPFWHALIDANQAQLPHPGNPDLLYVGITLVIPP